MIGVKEEYHSIELETLVKDTILDFSLYLKSIDDDKEKFVLYRDKNLPYTKENIDNLIQNNVKNLYINTEDEKIFKHYLRKNIGIIVKDKTIPVSKKSKILYSSAKDLLQDVFERPCNTETIKEASTFVKSTVDHLISEEEAFFTLLGELSQEYYTYTHSVNVSFYGIALAKKIGMYTKDELYDIGFGLIIHDIGKKEIPQEILNKRGKLTKREFEVVKRHPELGVKILSTYGNVPQCAITITRSHHENYEGGGYPRGLKGKEIDVFARVATIADVFDALTTDRAYRVGIDAFKALNEMVSEMPFKFDSELLKNFILLFNK